MPRPTLTYADLLTYVAAATKVSKVHVNDVLRASAGVISTFTRRGYRISLPDFGIFREKHSKARYVRYPNGELHELPEQYTVAFRAAKAMRRAAADRGRG